MAEVTEFDKAKQRYHKRNDKYVKLADRPKPVVKIPKNCVSVVITDNDTKYSFDFNLPNLAASRGGSLRTKEAYTHSVSEFIRKEFGKWQ